jgi:hypothetical protein
VPGTFLELEADRWPLGAPGGPEQGRDRIFLLGFCYLVLVCAGAPAQGLRHSRQAPLPLSDTDTLALPSVLTAPPSGHMENNRQTGRRPWSGLGW